MRCENCGWDNPAGNAKCEKCNAALAGVATPSNPPKFQEGFNPNKTINETDVFGSMGNSVENNSCPGCGYPARGSDKDCPNCGHRLNTTNRDTKRDTGPHNNHSDQPGPHAQQRSGGITGGTVPWWETAGTTSFCSLLPLPNGNEQTTRAELFFSGDQISLTRDNTDPGNPTITSKEQAWLMCENGKWYIKDASPLKTTYVCAKEKIELAPGDIIILGNRRFEFGIK